MLLSLRVWPHSDKYQMRKFINIITESLIEDTSKPGSDWLQLYRDWIAAYRSGPASHSYQDIDAIASYIADNTEYPATDINSVTHWVWAQQEADTPTTDNTDKTDNARLVWQSMSPLAHYRLINHLPYLPQNNERVEQAISYIANHMDEFEDTGPREDPRDLNDGGIHRLY